MRTTSTPCNRICALAAVITVTVAGCRSRVADRHAVVLVSLDGFRSEYLDWYDAHHLRALAARRVRAL